MGRNCIKARDLKEVGTLGASQCLSKLPPSLPKTVGTPHTQRPSGQVLGRNLGGDNNSSGQTGAHSTCSPKQGLPLAQQEYLSVLLPSSLKYPSPSCRLDPGTALLATDLLLAPLQVFPLQDLSNLTMPSPHLSSAGTEVICPRASPPNIYPMTRILWGPILTLTVAQVSSSDPPGIFRHFPSFSTCSVTME